MLQPRHTTKSRIDTVQSPGRGLVPVQSPFPEQCRFWITVCAGAVGGACALARIEASFNSAVSPSHSLSLLGYSGPDRVEFSLAAGNNILLMKPNPNGKQSFPQGCYSTMLVEETCRGIDLFAGRKDNWKWGAESFPS